MVELNVVDDCGARRPESPESPNRGKEVDRD